MKPENVKCPICGGPMTSRTSQYGKFWGCNDYPHCRGIRNSLGESKQEDHEDIGPDPYKRRWDTRTDSKE